MRRNPDVVAGIHQFEDSRTALISIGGITVYGAAPKVTFVMWYKLPYGPNGSACVLKLALAEGFSIHTLFGFPFQRKEELTYMTHRNQVVSSLWGLTFPVSFKKSESTVSPPPPPKDLSQSYKCLLQNFQQSGNML
jgi:hypothetical protein